MKRFTSKPSAYRETVAQTPVLSSNDLGVFDVDALLDKAVLVLQREIQQLVIRSASGKLEPEHARDLISYVQLLNKLREDMRKSVAQMDDEQLQNLSK